MAPHSPSKANYSAACHVWKYVSYAHTDKQPPHLPPPPRAPLPGRWRRPDGDHQPRDGGDAAMIDRLNIIRDVIKNCPPRDRHECHLPYACDCTGRFGRIILDQHNRERPGQCYRLNNDICGWRRHISGRERDR